MRDKIKTRKQLQTLLKGVRRKGRRIVFTNGCFDLLHVGHVRYLEKAKKMGDILIVAVNSDRSVRRIKEPGRPITPERERAEVLAALDCVDYVTLFDDPDPHKLIAAVLPDVLVKGSDWPKDKIIGREIIRARGGKVTTVSMVPRVSTTRIIQRILRSYGKDRTDSSTASHRTT